MKEMDEYKLEDSITYKEKSFKIALLEEFRTMIATELELEIWRRRNKFNHSHDKIAKDLGISYQASIQGIKRLNRRLRQNLIKLRIRGSNFF